MGFLNHSQDEHRELLASYLPTGDAWAAARKPGTNLYKFVGGLAREFKRIEETTKVLKDELSPFTTTLFLSEWEAALGIPDGCFDGQGSNTERLSHIIAKLVYMDVDTYDDYESLAAHLGFTVKVRAGGPFGTFPFTFPILFLNGPRFTILVFYDDPDLFGDVFPYTFPITFGTANIVRCVFDKIKPANCQVVYQLVDDLSTVA